MSFTRKLALFGTTALLLAGCGAEDVSTEDEDESTEPDTEEVAEESESVSEGEYKVGDTLEADGGTSEVVAVNYGINETVENGDFTVTLKDARLLQFEPSPEFVDMFEDESLPMIAFNIDVTNNSDATNTIYPDQGVAVTDTGQQIDAELLFSDDVGGDFLGQVTKSGEVLFLGEGDASEISNVRYIIGSGHDEELESFGEDIEFTVDF